MAEETRRAWAGLVWSSRTEFDSGGVIRRPAGRRAATVTKHSTRSAGGRSKPAGPGTLAAPATDATMGDVSRGLGTTPFASPPGTGEANWTGRGRRGADDDGNLRRSRDS